MIHWKKFLQNIPEKIIGIYAQDMVLYLTQLVRKEDGWQVGRSCCFSFAPDETADWNEQVMEQVKVICMKEHLSCQAVGLCLPENQVFFYEKDMPELKQRELAEAVHWELAANGPFGEQEMISSFQAAGEKSGRFLLAALERSKQEEISRFYEENSLGLQALTMMPESVSPRWEGGKICWQQHEIVIGASAEECVWSIGQCASLYAAFGVIFPDDVLNFLPRQRRRSSLAWQRIAAGMLLMVLLLFTGGFSFYSWKLYAMDQQLKAQENRLVLLAGGQKSMQNAQKLNASIDKKNQLLTELSQDTVSCRGILVHLGARTVEGVWLDELVLSEDHTGVELRGHAVGYDAFAVFLESFEKDQDFFAAGPLLKSSRQAKDHPEEIEFLLDLKLK